MGWDTDMPEINWNALSDIPDIGASFTNAYNRGRETRALTDYAQNPNDPNALNALAPFKPDYVVQQKQAMAAKQQEEIAKRIDLIGQAAQWADTPEKWDAAVDNLSRQYPDLAQYKGKFTPEGRMAAIASAGQMKEYFANQKAQHEMNAPIIQGPGAAIVSPDGKTVLQEARFAPRPVTVGEGQTAVVFDPSNPGGGGNAAAALKTNPGALKDGAFARSQPGYTGSSGGFATFATPEQGIAAQEALLRGAYVGKGFNTIDKIVNRYAPQGNENSGASVNNYKAYIAQRTGIDVNAPINPADVPKVAAAMREFETGRRPGGSTGTVIAQGPPKPDKNWTTMTPAEVQAAGLPEGVYQTGPHGEIKPVSGTVGKAGAGGQQAYSQSAIDAFNRAIDSGNRLLQHPGFSSAVGVKGITGGLLGGWVVPGTDAADFKAELDAMKAQVFLPMVQSMKGMGALSNAEGEKLTAAIGALDTKMSENAFKASLQRIIRDLSAYRDRGMQQPKAAAPAPAAPRQAPRNAPSVSNW